MTRYCVVWYSAIFIFKYSGRNYSRFSRYGTLQYFKKISSDCFWVLVIVYETRHGYPNLQTHIGVLPVAKRFNAHIFLFFIKQKILYGVLLKVLKLNRHQNIYLIWNTNWIIFSLNPNIVVTQSVSSPDYLRNIGYTVSYFRDFIIKTYFKSLLF